MAGQPITVDRAIRLVSNYNSNQYPRLHQDTAADFQDTKSVWFSLQMMKDYIAELDGQTGIDGIRFHFGAYGNGRGSTRNGYSNHQTIIMVPTIEGDTNSQYDIDKHHDVCQGPDNNLQRINLSESGRVLEGDLKLLRNEGNGFPPPPPYND